MCRDREKAGIKTDPNSRKIKLSCFEIMCSGKALGALLGLIRDLTGTSTSPKKGDAFSQIPFSLSSSLTLRFLLSFSLVALSLPASPFLYQDARETFRGNAGVTVAGAAGCIFFTILFMILISPR